jgi:Protein of unknown function (DUF3253)
LPRVRTAVCVAEEVGAGVGPGEVLQRRLPQAQATMITAEAIRAKLLDLASRRSEGATFCPSEAARGLSKDWRPLMPRVREVAAELVGDGQLICTQRGPPAHPLTTRGAIRLARGFTK